MKSKSKNMVVLVIISISAAIIYQVPYLKSVFYDALREALNVSHTELGSLNSIYGVVAMFSYIPGGVLADKIRMKYLFPGSLIACGLLIFWYAALPPLGALRVIHFLLAIFSVLTFWSARIKVVRFLSNETDYPTNQGISNALYGLGALGASFIAMAIIDHSVTGIKGLKAALIFYAAAHVVLGILSYFLIPKFDGEVAERAKERLNIKEFIAAMKMPNVWLVSLSLFMTYTIFITIPYTTPYFTNIYLAPVAMITAVSIIRTYGVNIVSSPIFGFLSKKVGSVAKMVVVFSGCVALLAAAFFIVPVNSSMVIIVIILSILCAFFANGMNAVAVSQLGEVGVPKNIFGSASGIASLIGYLPDVFIYIMIGAWLDNYPGVEGYNRVFILIIAVALVSALLGILIMRAGRKVKSNKAK